MKLLVAASFTILLSSQSALAGFPIKKITLIFGKLKKTITVEVAETDAQHSLGLMNRKSMSVDSGMLFIFPDEEIREFWMKNTLINLDIAYFDKSKKAIDIQNMKAMTSILQTQIPTYPSKKPAQFALEMNDGWFKKNHFPEGSKFEFSAGPLSK